MQIESACSRFAREVVLVRVHARNFFYLFLATNWAARAIDRLIVGAVLQRGLAIVGLVAIDVVIAGAACMILWVVGVHYIIQSGFGPSDQIIGI